MTGPELVTLQIWRLPQLGAPALRLWPHALRHHLGFGRGSGRPTFSRWLGTGRPESPTIASATPSRWALLCCWESATDAREHWRSDSTRALDSAARAGLRLQLVPTRSHGHWAGEAVFGNPGPRPVAGGNPGPVAVLTHARLHPWKVASFVRTSTEPGRNAAAHPGNLLALGVAEVPLTTFGTFTLWRTETAMLDYSYGDDAHRAAIRASRIGHWYAESVFARFRVSGLQRFPTSAGEPASP